MLLLNKKDDTKFLEFESIINFSAFLYLARSNSINLWEFINLLSLAAIATIATYYLLLCLSQMLPPLLFFFSIRYLKWWRLTFLSNRSNEPTAHSRQVVFLDARVAILATRWPLGQARQEIDRQIYIFFFVLFLIILRHKFRIWPSKVQF